MLFRSEPGVYDAQQEERRAELEANAAEETRLTDSGQRGVKVADRV